MLHFFINYSIVSAATKLRHFSDLKLGISVPARGENSDLLNNAEGEKNDYDWLVALFLFLVTYC